MALINCPECKHQVSDIAQSCPQCGTPISEINGNKASGSPTSTIQETSKKFKMHILLASSSFWIGIFWFFSTINTTDQAEELNIIPILLYTAGAVWYIATKARIWWHHK